MMNWERLRYMDGEEAGWTGVETVALGAINRRDGLMYWWPLTNVHESPAHNFAVHGEEVQSVLQEMADKSCSPHVLWHSHSADEAPSMIDIEQLPHWLAMGVVWCAASGESAAYDKTGFISSTSADALSTTGDIEEAISELEAMGMSHEDAKAAAYTAIKTFDLE